MKESLLKQYNEEEIKELLENNTKLVYIDTGMEEIVARYNIFIVFNLSSNFINFFIINFNFLFNAKYHVIIFSNCILHI